VARAGEIVLSAFGHYPLIGFPLAKALRAPLAGKAGSHAKATVQRLLLCPELSRMVIAYGSEAGASGTCPILANARNIWCPTLQLLALHLSTCIALPLRMMHALRDCTWLGKP
jgi:hypothetical protein